jgi:hypothetical protein
MLFKNIKIRPMFAWYDIWVGLFIDKAKSTAYFFPLPMLGLKIKWEKPVVIEPVIPITPDDIRTKLDTYIEEISTRETDRPDAISVSSGVGVEFFNMPGFIKICIAKAYHTAPSRHNINEWQLYGQYKGINIHTNPYQIGDSIIHEWKDGKHINTVPDLFTEEEKNLMML